MFNIQNSVTEENEFFAKYDKSYLEAYDEMFMITYLYLQRHRSIEGYVNLTIKDFLLYYNMTPDRKKGRINDKVKNTFQLMVDQEFICYIGCFSNGGLSSVKDVDCDMMFTVKVINNITKWNPESKFIKVLYSEIDILRNHKVNPINKILNVYVNIKKYISGDENSPGAMMVSYPSKESLSKSCGYGVSTIDSYVDTLCDIGMLFVKNYGSYKRIRKGQEVVLNSNNIYALDRKYLNDDYVKKPFIEYLKNNYGFVDGFYPLCNNLPDVDLNDDKDKIEKDYSVAKILETSNSKVNTEVDFHNEVVTFQKPVKSKEIHINVDDWLDCPQKARQTGCSMNTDISF